MSDLISRPNLSADIYSDSTGKKWSAKIHKHPAKGGNGVLIWERHGMRSQRNAEMAMEASYRALSTATRNPEKE